MARQDTILLSIDYVQCELRVMAHFCQDPALISLLCTLCHDSLKCVPWLIHMCAMTLSYVKLLSRSRSYLPCLLPVCMSFLPHRCLWVSSHGSLLSRSCSYLPPLYGVIWRICMCAMTHSHVWHESFTYVPWLFHTSTLVKIPPLSLCSVICTYFPIYGLARVGSHGSLLTWSRPYVAPLNMKTWLIHTHNVTYSYA